MEIPDTRRHSPQPASKGSDELPRRGSRGSLEKDEQDPPTKDRDDDNRPPEGGNADDLEHNMKFLVLEDNAATPQLQPPLSPPPPEEKIVIVAPLLPSQDQPEKFLVVMPPPPVEEKIAVDAPVPPAEEKIALNVPATPHLRNVEGEGGQQEKRQRGPDRSSVSLLTSAARDMGIGMAHVTGGTLKASAALPQALAKGVGKGLPTTMYGGAAARVDPEVTGWKSGMSAAGKGMYHGFRDGFTEFALQPYEGAKEEGAKGFFKGCGKGLTGLVLKPTAGALSAPGHAFMGVYREVQKSADRLENQNKQEAGRDQPKPKPEAREGEGRPE